jgi:hypothetical protein
MESFSLLPIRAAAIRYYFVANRKEFEKITNPSVIPVLSNVEKSSGGEKNYKDEINRFHTKNPK